ncbi:HAD-like protein [Gonapodya prolifera JEL478]|uniref:HAD-like protein n=1 Tax=Gonapodya prolifera (strain JEL478) TaxID=1344416 RepID=A0A139A124_GONPJ|nr:HAD-like protein [Gonapodya prolifera JEL478]|eukprot:KXS10053.1 HAD-like protein [Gonapodya prolifera JEL478]
MATKSYKGVLFDIGGVVTGSPIQGIMEYEKKHGIPRGYINFCIFSSGVGGAWDRLERGELKVGPAFFRELEKDVGKPENVGKFKQYYGSRGVATPDISGPITINGEECFRTMNESAKLLDQKMVKAIDRLRAAGLRVGALTNNSKPEGQPTVPMGHDSSEPHRHIPSLFHAFVESAIIGHRKPHPEAFLIACKELGVEPRETVFLDDIGTNLKGAQQLGMTTIQVKIGESEEAIRALEKYVGVKLLD